MNTPIDSLRLSSPSSRLLLDQCIHCGLCLPACPTYALWQTEMDGPRGRIALMRAAAEGRIRPEGALRRHLDLCLGCRACETACPSGVQYGTLLERARADLAEHHRAGPVERRLRRLALRELMPQRERLRWLARVSGPMQRLGLTRLAARLPGLPRWLRTMAELLPPELQDVHAPVGTTLAAQGPRRGKVFFLAGCIQDAFLGHVNTATIRVLRRWGYDVTIPQGQTCCGAAALHLGDEEDARRLARRNIDACRGDAPIISNAGGCGAALKEYGHLLHDDREYAAAAADFAARVRDISEFLAAQPELPEARRLNVRVTYADSCHLRHGQRVVAEPRSLLAALPGVELVELERPDMCCGSAGVYNIVQAETADSVLDAKMKDVAGTQAQVVVTTNTGCHMQLVHGVRRAGLGVRVMHLVELLDQAYGEAER